MDSFWIANGYRNGGAMSSGAQWDSPIQWEVQRIRILRFRMQRRDGILGGVWLQGINVER